MTTTAKDSAWDAVRELAAAQGWIVSRRQLYAAGLTRWQVKGQLRAGRWQRVADQSVCLHNGPLDEIAHRWAALFQGGPRACLDGASALVAGGLERYGVDRIRVSLPRGAKCRRTVAYDIRQTRRLHLDDLVKAGIPRTRPAIAAVRGALWASSDRIRRDKRRNLVHAVINELIDGARSLGELDVGRELRRRGLPSPSRQSLRRDRRGRYFLDLYWPDWHLVVEVDGIHHAWVENVVNDALRQNSLAIAGDTVLRLPLLGLRLQPDEFFNQIEEALLANGWAPAAVA